MRMLARRMRFLSQYLGLSVRSNMTCDRTTLPVNTDANKNGFQPSFESSASLLLISSSVPEMSLYSIRVRLLRNSLSPSILNQSNTRRTGLEDWFSKLEHTGVFVLTLSEVGIFLEFAISKTQRLNA
jgi:hypothetical protein